MVLSIPSIPLGKTAPTCLAPERIMLAPIPSVTYCEVPVKLANALACFMLLLKASNDELSRMDDESFLQRLKILSKSLTDVEQRESRVRARLVHG